MEIHEKSVGKCDNQQAGKNLGKKTYLLSDPFPMEEIILGYTKKEVLDLLYRGGNPHSISNKLRIARSTTIQHLQELRDKGLAKKGSENNGNYGDLWEITKKGIFLVEKGVGFPAKSSRVGKTKRGGKIDDQVDDINGHAFVFTLELPKSLKRWDRREEILDKLGIKFKPLKHLFGGGQGILLDGKKIHITGKSIVIYESESYIAKISKDSRSKAVNHFRIFIKKLERIFEEDFRQGGRYKFRVSRQHYALIQNALAKQYNSENKKLEVFSGKGRLIYLIDNSPTEENIFGENHFEAVDPLTSHKDITPAQNFFKSLSQNPITPEDIKADFNEIRAMMKESSQTQIMLSQVMKQLESNVIHLTKIVGKKKQG